MKKYFLLIFFLPSVALAQLKLEELQQGVYRFQNKAHFSVVIEGEKSLFVADPLEEKGAKWLKRELRKRFPNKPIKYLFYSHNHWDHVAGGQFLADKETIIISQIEAAKELRRQKAPTKYPMLSFKKQINIDLDGLELNLIYFGRNNGRGNSIVLVPEKKFLFGVDWVLLKRLPWIELYYYDIDGMINSLTELLRYDFKQVSPGHSVVGTKKDLEEFYHYLVDLRSAVLTGMIAGKTRDELMNSIKLPKYKHFAKYKEWLKPNIKGVFDQMERASGRYGQLK